MITFAPIQGGGRGGGGRGREVYSLENLNQTGLVSKHRSAGVRHGTENGDLSNPTLLQNTGTFMNLHLFSTGIRGSSLEKLNQPGGKSPQADI